MKPVFSQRGAGVYKVTRKGRKYIVGYQKSEIKLNRKEFMKLLIENVFQKRYIAQKYIHSKSKYGNPYDCRIHVEKNQHGKWEIAKMYIRVGIG